MNKYRTWTDTSFSGSEYFNFEFTDDELKDEFEMEIGYESSYSVRLSDHKRPPVVDGCSSYEHNYFYETTHRDLFNIATEYLISILNKFCKREISIEQLNDLLFNKCIDDMSNWMEGNK